MAKKITIPGGGEGNSPLLNSLQQPWGGIGDGTQVHGITVPAGVEWGINRDEIERFIKAQFKGKCGSACFSPEPNASNHYELWGFATAADQATYMTEYNSLSSGETMPSAIEELRLFCAELPISATDVDSYSLSLSTSLTGSTQANPIVVKRGAPLEVPLRILAWHYPPNGTGDAANFDRQPNIVVERSGNGGSTWDVVGTVGVTGIAESLSDDSFPNVVDIGSMADTGGDGSVMIRFQIPSYVYTNAAGDIAVMASNRVVIYLRTVTLGISMAVTDWISPIRIGDNQTSFGIKFTLQGSVAKTLHVKMTDVSGNETYDVTTPGINTTGELNYTIADDSGTMGLTNSGVHTLTAWLTYGTGDDAITSDVIVHQLLVLKPSTAGSVGAKVLIQQMAQKVDNFVQSLICHYWVWNPILDDGIYRNNTEQNMAVRFVVADSPNISEEHTEYVSLPVSVTPGTDQELLATMEVETAISQDTYTARLHALSSSGAALLSPPRQFTIDNTSGFQPTADSVFHLNPKSRYNDEDNARTILNARNSNALVASTWSETFKMDASDGWVTDDNGEKVLRVPSGRLLEITGFNPFDHFYTSPASSKALALEIDFQVNNVTNEDDPVLRICEATGIAGHYLGLRLRPMIGTMGCVTDNNEATTDFRWAEGRRQHLAITITPGVSPNVSNDARYTSGYSSSANGTINLVRVYLNGVIVRETRYNPANRSEFCTGALSNGGIIIGQVGEDGRGSGADIDIYGIRVWERVLTPKQVLQNYVSALPGSTEKRIVKAANDITLDDNSGRISLAKACMAGKTCMIWHGEEVMFGDDSKKGWLEIRRYDYNGNFMPQYSGSFCKATKKLKGKGQGTTAMTYFYWNTQWKFGDVGYNTDLDYDRLDPGQCLVLVPSQINSNVHLGTPVQMSTLSAKDQRLFEMVDAAYTHVCPVYGGNLGADEPVGTATKYYPCTIDGNDDVVTIMLPDGWVNGSGDLYDASMNPTGGLYCGPCWQAGAGLPYGSKHVLKINYASSMQSHLIGINWLYNELHKEYCGSNSLQRDVTSAVVAKQVVPVMFFTAGVNVTNATETESTANFRGLGGFGPGKMDKPSWGYSKKASKITDSSSDHYRPNGHDYFAMFEGAVNNSVLSDMIAPWDDTDHLDAGGNVIQRAKVKYFLHDPFLPENKDPECFYYRHTVLQDGEVIDSWEKGIGFDGGKTGRSTVENPSTAEELFQNLLANNNSCDDPDNAPSAAITAILRNAWNYVYLHNPNIRYFNGTLDQLAAANLTEAQRKRKYITRDNFLLKRWDFCERRWVDAGLWNTSSHAYDAIDIFEAIGSPSNIQDDKQAVVDAYIAQIVAEARPSNSNETNGIGAYFKAKSLRFHYAFQNHFIAGTDNCSKNTYYVIDPVTHLIELHQDDVDTTIATDNFGFQTKPYYVDRMNPYDDNDTVRAENESCYDGMLNTLFDLVESMWAENGTIASAVGSILGSMLNMTGGIGSTESNEQGGVWRTLNRYLFDIQRYFPQVAFNETARIRYEFPAMLGFIGRNGEADPLAQSMGDQLEAEIQFMKRRLIYMASYAGFGEFAASTGTSTGSTGIGDAVAALAVNSVALPNGGVPNQTFTVKPHQYLFPVFTWQSQTNATRRRTAPGEAFTYTTTFQFANTYPIELRGLNYYRSVGNLGDKTINASSFTIQGTRLTEFIAEPTTYYSTTQGGGSITRSQYEALSDAEKAGYAPAFSRPANLQISNDQNGATRLRKLSLNGCATTGSTAMVPLNLSKLTLVEEIDLRNTAIQAVTIPETATLATLHLPKSITALALTGQPSLATLDFAGYDNLTQLAITGSPLLSAASRSFAYGMMNAGANVTRLDLTGVVWDGNIAVGASLIRFILGIGDRGSAMISGRIVLTTSTTNGENKLSYSDVKRLLVRYGDVRSEQNSLYVGFGDFDILQSNISIGGRKYVVPSLITMISNEKWWIDADGSGEAGLWEEISGGNTIDIARDGNGVPIRSADGAYYPALTWELIGQGASGFGSFPNAQLPKLKLSNEDGTNVTLTVRLTLKTVKNETFIVDKIIGLWNRVPGVGDYAWTDGQFDTENDPSKILAGAVVMREVIRDGNGDISEYKIWVVGDGTCSMPLSSDGDSASVPAVSGNNMLASWGLYPDATLGLPNTVSGDAFADELIETLSQALQSWVKPQGVTLTTETAFKGKTVDGVFNTPLPDKTGSATLRKTEADIAASGEIAMQDNSTDDGWKVQTAGYLTNYLDTEDENAIAKSYADAILNATISYLGISNVTYPTTLQELSDITMKVVRYAGAKLQNCTPSEVDLTQDNLARFRELLFPAFRMAWCWSPADIAGNGATEASLHEQYRRGKWLLPSSGLLARIFNFVGNSRSNYNSSSTSIDESLANHNALEAARPIYANALDKGRGFNVSPGSYHWSSTEYYRGYARSVNFGNGGAYINLKYGSIVVRPVTAFRFVP